MSRIAYKDVMILLVEDDEGHAELIKDCLKETGVDNPIRRFRDGQEILDYLFEGPETKKELAGGYLVLLDIRIPKVDGQEVLRRIKSDERLKSLPVVMLTTTDDPREVQASYRMGCNAYLTKPVDYESFTELIRYLGQFIRILRIAPIEE
ncbi:MAG TPA: response regulator [Deltaproteobacteria bacterium]|nr:response regulator [Deltaproteobacteria bacterium]